jgi:CxxC motif-containing protein (DUF1111 family)
MERAHSRGLPVVGSVGLPGMAVQLEDHPPKTELEPGVAVSMTMLPSWKFSEQLGEVAAPQLRVAGEMQVDDEEEPTMQAVTTPEPVPLR